MSQVGEFFTDDNQPKRLKLKRLLRVTKNEDEKNEENTFLLEKNGQNNEKINIDRNNVSNLDKTIYNSEKKNDKMEKHERNDKFEF